MPLTINGKYLAGQPGGVQRVAREMVRALAARMEELRALFGATPRVLAPPNADIAGAGAGGGFPVVRRGVLRGHLWEQVELPARARHALLLNLCNLAPLAGARSITMIHDAQAFATPESYSWRFVRSYRAVQPLIGRRALRLLTVSEFSAGQLASFGIAPRERITVIHNGVDHAARVTAVPAIVTRLGLTAGRYVLALATDQAHKNIAVLLAAMRAPALRDVTLVLFGATDAARLAAAGLALPPNAIAAGRVSDGELRALMEGALCFCMPSRTEGFGLPPLEAMLLGCPAVVSPCGALPEVCGAAALYAGPDAPAEWAEAIDILARDSAGRGARSAAGIAHARQFTWDKAADRLIAVLREVAGDADGGRRRRD